MILRKLQPLLCFLIAALAVSATHGQTIRFVDADASGSGDGLNWATAYQDLQDALDDAAALPGAVQIWIAEGVYLPDRGTLDRTMSFELSGDLSLYGGFAGGEGQLDERDPATHAVVLSGDLRGDDQADFVNYGDNTENLVQIFDPDGPVLIDGITVRGGNGDFDGDLLIGGGAVFARDSEVTLHDCAFIKNRVGEPGPSLGNFGGAVFLRGSGTLDVEQCVFQDNHANAGGALGVALVDGSGTLTLRVNDCEFTGNDANLQVGGAVYLNDTSATFERCRFEDNEADYAGAIFGVLSWPIVVRDCDFIGNEGTVRAGAIWLDRCDELDATPAEIVDSTFANNFSEGGEGGAVHLGETITHLVNCGFLGNETLRFNPQGNPEGVGGAVYVAFGSGHKLVNCLFSGNFAAFGGGTWYFRADVDVTHCTFVNNSTETVTAGAGMAIQRATATINNSIFWGNRRDTLGDELAQIGVFDGVAVLRSNIVEGWTGAFGGSGNFSADPMFVDADGDDDLAGTLDDNARLMDGSPAIERGRFDLLPADFVDLDADGDRTEVLPLDLDRELRVVDELPDLGPYEFGSSGIPGDVDADGDVDLRDLATLLAAFNTCEGDPLFNPDADFDGSGCVDLSDLATLLGNFGT